MALALSSSIWSTNRASPGCRYQAMRMVFRVVRVEVLGPVLLALNVRRAQGGHPLFAAGLVAQLGNVAHLWGCEVREGQTA